MTLKTDFNSDNPRLAAKAFQLLIGILVLFCPINSTFADQPKSTTEGGRPAGTYQLSDFDNVNLFNGNLNFRLPLVTLGGRGEVSFTISSVYENRWTTTVGYEGQCPVYSWQPSGSSHLSLREFGLGDRSATYDYVMPGSPCTNDYYEPTRAIYVPTFTNTDGTTYEFHSVANSGGPIQIPAGCSAVAGTNLGKEFVTWDGSGMKLIYDYDLYYNGYTSTLRTSPNGPPLSGGTTVLFPNGTRYRMDSNVMAWLEDKNGNRITFHYGWNSAQTYYGVTQIVDSMGRSVNIDTDVNEAPYGNHTKITYKGFGGALRTIRMGEIAIWLPDNRTYSFTYNENRELTRVDLPTGGAYEYEWGGNIPSPPPPCQSSNDVAFRYVTERRVKADGINLSSRMTFSAPNGVTDVNTYDAANNLVSHTKHYFHGDPVPPLPPDNPHWTYAAGEENLQALKGKEYRTDSYGGNGALVKFNESTWVTPRQVTWTLSPETQTININARIESTQVTLVDVSPNLVAKTEYVYNQGQWASTFFNVLTDTREYDYGQGAVGTFIRRSHSEYISYDSGSYQTQPYIPLLPTEQWISSDLAGNNKSLRTQYEYDNYVADANHAQLVDRANIVAHNPARGTAYTLRGNATKVTRYQNAQNQTGAVSIYSQYDIAGNIIKSIDPLGYATQFWFTNATGSQDNGTPDDFGSPDGNAQLSTRPIELSSTNQYAYALPVRVTNALGQSTFTQTDFYTGQAVDAEDANGVVSSSYSEFDSLDRLTKIIHAANKDASVKAQTVFNYDDTARVITTTSDLNIFGDGVLISKAFYDGLGRTIETRQYEGGANYIAVQTEYDALGRPYKNSNPFRPWQSEIAIWTTQNFDALGRVKSNTTPDGAVVSSSYLGNTTTVSDQTGKQRKSVTDALGRLVAVYEDPSSGGLNYLTSYTYDVLDNLTGVSQGFQSRSFVYDSLRRLTSATNPESGTVSYQYDNAGNLLVKTDARGVSAHFAYDSLSRIVRRWYNGSNSVSSTINNNPPLPSSVGASDEANFYYDNQTLPTGAPSFSRGASIGRTVAITYGGSTSTTGDYSGYDSVGRYTLKIQRTGTKDYELHATYNVAGLPLTVSYPSLNNVAYGFDDAGRIVTFTGTLGDGKPRNYSTEVLYSPFGALTKEKFGTTTPNLYNKLFYNSRGQLAEVRVSSSWTGLTDTTWNRGRIINSYSDFCSGMSCGSNSTTAMTDNNGNLRKQEIDIPNNDAIPTTDFSHRLLQYDYDALNRLRWAKESLNSVDQWRQWFGYDRYGNRTIDNSQDQNDPHTRTYGTGINNKAFSVALCNSVADPCTNRLGVPTGQSGTMHYNEVGNLDNDTYTGVGTRTYDAENKMTSAVGGIQTSGNQLYKYDASGQRIKRTIDNVETWQVFGFNGELVAEYAANAIATSPKKEYGYRNGQLLISADSGNASAPPVFGDDFNDNSLSLISWSTWYSGAPTVSEQSQQLQIALIPSTAGYNGVYSNATYDLTNRMVQVELAQSVSQAGWCENFLELELNANNYFMIQVGAGNMLFRSRVNGVNDQTSIPFDSTAHRFWRIRHDQSANLIYFETKATDSVWLIRKTVTPGFSLTSLRFHLLAGAYGSGNSNPGTAKYDNFKLLASNTDSTSLSVANAGFEAPVIGNGSWQYSPSGGTWTFANGGGISGMNSAFTGIPSAAPDGVQVAFIQGTGTVSQSISGFQASNNYIITFSAIQRTNCCNTTGQDIGVYIDSTLVGTFHPSNSAYVEYSTIPFTTTTGTHTVKFAGLNGAPTGETAFIDKVRITGSSKPGFGVQWLVTDQLGTPRMVFDESFSLANQRRHDYLPFGEELFAGTGGRTTTQGYSAGDGVRQQFTSKERDLETGLDYFLARYYSSLQGRFITTDQFDGNPSRFFVSFDSSPSTPYANLLNPQTLNLYAYVLNDPLSNVDEDGHQGRKNPRGYQQPLPGNTRYKIRTDLRNPNDSPNIHVFDKGGKREIGRVAIKPGGNEWEGKVPQGVKASVEEYIRVKGIQPRLPGQPLVPDVPPGTQDPQPEPNGGTGGGRLLRGTTNSITVFGYILGGIIFADELHEAETNGYYINYQNQVVITDLGRSAQHYPQGYYLQFGGHLWKPKDGTWRSVDCGECELQLKNGELTVIRKTD